MSNPRTQNPDEHIALFIARVRERIHRFLYGPKPAFLAPLGWILTFQIFAISTMWYISMMPITIGLDVYERHVRTIFPRLPSIRNLLLSVRMKALAVFADPPLGLGGVGSSAAGSSSHQGSQNMNASAAPLPTLNVDLDAIRAGG